MENTLDEFTNMVNTNSQLCHSRHLLVHLMTPKHHQLFNQQQLLPLLQHTNIKKILFYIPKIPSRMMQPSQTMMTYILVRHPNNKIIAFQPFQHLIIIHNVFLSHPQVD